MAPVPLTLAVSVVLWPTHTVSDEAVRVTVGSGFTVTVIGVEEAVQVLPLVTST